MLDYLDAGGSWDKLFVDSTPWTHLLIKDGVSISPRLAIDELMNFAEEMKYKVTLPIYIPENKWTEYMCTCCLGQRNKLWVYRLTKQQGETPLQSFPMDAKLVDNKTEENVFYHATTLGLALEIIRDGPSKVRCPKHMDFSPDGCFYLNDNIADAQDVIQKSIKRNGSVDMAILLFDVSDCRAKWYNIRNEEWARLVNHCRNENPGPSDKRWYAEMFESKKPLLYGRKAEFKDGRWIPHHQGWTQLAATTQLAMLKLRPIGMIVIESAFLTPHSQ